MATPSMTSLSVAIPLEEYLNTTYRPDVDYVDGQIEERNLGEFDHGDLQLHIGTLLRNKQEEWGVRVLVETRVQTTPTRVRIPDVCVLSAGLPRERIIRTPPLLCIEILSPRDTLKAMRKRSEDYFQMGVKNVWIFDTESRTAFACTAIGFDEHKSGELRVDGTRVRLSIEEVFSTLDA